jgi:hypothetical protein
MGQAIVDVNQLSRSFGPDGSIDLFRHSALARGGAVVDSRDARLEEIFLARAGRNGQQVAAA